jgi:signal transduction histidine kinase
VSDRLEAALKNLKQVESWLAEMYEEVQGDEHIYMAETRIREAMFLLRHTIDQLEGGQQEAS